MDKPPDEYEQKTLAISLVLLGFAINSSLLFAVLAVMLLLMCSALISGSEVAFFSISKSDLKKQEEKQPSAVKRVRKLLSKPRLLLSTILIINNLVNVSIIVLTYFIIHQYLNVPAKWTFLIEVVLVTILLLLFGEIIPKIYASQNSFRLASLLSKPMLLFQKIFQPISMPLVASSDYIEKRLKNKSLDTSLEEITEAIDLTAGSNTKQEDIDILKGIVQFSNISARQIMTSRVDMTAVENTTPLSELLEIIKVSGYSRIPVYKENLDQILGILHVKDLLKYLNKADSFQWQNLLRGGFFVPETKKIDDLLRNFQAKRTHLAIVVDEYGGTSGIITLEDVMEEIIGEIQDEFDEDEEINFEKIDSNTFRFEGKTQLNDFCRIIDTDQNTFDAVKGESDSLAGLILEINGHLPEVDDEILFENFRFTVNKIDQNRISSAFVTILALDE